MAPIPSARTRATSASRWVSDSAVSPTTWRTPQASRVPWIGTASSGRPSWKIADGRSAGSGHEEDRQRGASRPVTPGGPAESLTKDARRCRNGRHAGDNAWIRTGNGSRVETSATDLPDHHEVVAVGVPDAVHGGPEGLVRLAAAGDEATHRRCDRQVQTMAFGFERIGGGRGCRGPLLRRSGETWPCCGVDGATSAPGCPDPGRESRDCALFRGTQEALEVTQSVAAITARVDPVVAQPSGVAPGSDRVRVDAKEPGRLGHREGRVRGSEGVVRRHGSQRKCEVDASTLPISQFLPIG